MGRERGTGTLLQGSASASQLACHAWLLASSAGVAQILYSLPCSSPRWESGAGSKATEGCEGQGEAAFGPGPTGTAGHGCLGSPRCCLVAKAAWPSQLVALEATNLALGSTGWLVPITLCAPLCHRPQAEGLLSPSPAFCHAVAKHVPNMVLDGPPSPSNVLTRILWASEGIISTPGSGGQALDVNLLSSSLNFPLSSVSLPRWTCLPLAPWCRACGGKPRRLETPGSSSTIIECDRNTLTRRPRCLQLICIANSI